MVEADVVRARLAAVLDNADETPHRIGEVSLHEHQRVAVRRARATLRMFGGVLLADAVGLGKTYTALAVARDYTKPAVIAPAVLRGQWCEAARATGVRIAFASTESLSRGFLPAGGDIVIVDEAHHFRTPATARYSKLAELTATTPVLLLTATPVHNSRRDLDTLIALFLGSHSSALSDDETARCIVRREHSDVPTLRIPRLHRVRRIEIPGSPRIVEAIRSLPDPLPLSDGQSAGALVRVGLLHQWASSDAALLGGIRRRLLSAEAVRDTLRTGLIPSRREIAAWLTEDAVQLGFTELLVQPEHSAGRGALPALEIHVAALEAIAALLKSLPPRDDSRHGHLRQIRRSHTAQIVAFSAYAQTVRSLFRALARDGAVAMISGAGGWISSGRMPAIEVLRMFRAPGHDRERIDLLLATDLLSEGLDLPEASVIVHLDLPWTAARMEQRVGRLRRVGGTTQIITRYAFVQPVALERRIRKEMLLTRKAQAAAAVVGSAAGDAKRLSSARAAELSRQVAARWCTGSQESSTDDMPDLPAPILTAAVRSETPGFVAAVRTRRGHRLVCGMETASDCVGSFDPRRVYAMLLHAEGAQAAFPAKGYRRARRVIDRTLRTESLEDSIRSKLSGAVILEALRRLRRAVVTALPHQRPRLAVQAATLTDALSGRLTIGMERRVEKLLADASDDAEFVTRCAALLHACPRVTDAPPRLTALLLLVRG